MHSNYSQTKTFTVGGFYFKKFAVLIFMKAGKLELSKVVWPSVPLGFLIAYYLDSYLPSLI